VFNVLRKSTCGVLAVAVVVFMSLNSPAKAAETGKITGKVTGKDGPVAGAKVRLIAPGAGKHGDKPAAAEAGQGGKGQRPKPVAEATTESDGSFKMMDIPAGDYVLGAMAKGHGRAREKIHVKAGEMLSVQLALKEGEPGKGKGGKGKKQGQNKSN
jgi:hypothetical protein